MSKKATEINPIRAERVKTIIDREDINQQKLAELIFQTQQNVSRIIQKRQPLTEETARAIIRAFPAYRLQWLLGYDDIMLQDDYKRAYIDRLDAANNAVMTLIDASVREISAREGIDPPPVIDNIPEYLILEAQIRDFADGLIYNYIRHRSASHLWSLLDQTVNK